MPATIGITFIYPQALWLLLILPAAAGLPLLGRRHPTPVRFWSILVLRAVLLILLILALAGIQIRGRTDVLTAVFVLDASDSVPEEEQARGEAFVRQALRAMPDGDRAALVVFGQDALVERLASEERTLQPLASVPVTVRTDVAGALQLGMALFPEEGAKRLVLLSDGRENVSQALAQAELAAARGIQLGLVPLGGPEGELEVRVQALDAPAVVRQGQGFELVALIHSTGQVGATLHIFGDGQLIHSQEVQLQPGDNRFSIPVEAGSAGFRRFRAQVVPDADTWLQNNEASAFTVVHGPPHVLLVEGQPGEGDNLAQALREAEMEVSVVAPGLLPSSLPDMTAFDAIVLANVPAAALPPGGMEAIHVYVRDLGGGLLVVGGEDAFGAGGYLRTPLEETLPVDMDVRSKEQSPNLALVLAVDKSGSMGRCHCDNPDLNQTYERREVGQPKVDIAKEAVMRAASALGQQDYLGVVTFDEAARWALEVDRVADIVTLEQSIGSVQATGQTNLHAGVEAGYAALQATTARRKHLILLTDGWVRQGDLAPLAREMREDGITLSVVAAGGGSAEYLADLAETGGGRYYPAGDILQVPDFFLKETITAVGEYVIEELFYPLPSGPSSVLKGLDPARLPPLYGYNGTTPKSTAFVSLGTPRGDPLLATWQYGLGRAAVWTSDMKGQWATEWVTWDSFARFAAQLVGWTLPPPQVEGLTAQARLEADQAVIQVEAVHPSSPEEGGATEAGLPRNFLDMKATLIGPDLQATDALIEQVGAGRYEGRVALTQPGTYLVRIGVSEGGKALGRQTLGLVMPYSPEYQASGTDYALLGQWARLTGGGELPDAAAAFTHNLPIAERAREVGAWLLLVAVLLFPIDVALRRVVLGPGELRRAVAWLRARLPLRPGGAVITRERTLARLFEARDRVRQRHPAGGEPTGSPQSSPAESSTASSPTSQDGPILSSLPASDALARLHEAKRRARRED